MSPRRRELWLRQGEGRDGPHRPPAWLTTQCILVVAAILSAGVLALDWRIHETSSPAVFYTGIVVLIAFSRRARLIIPAAVLFTAMTWLGWAIKPAGEPLWHSMVARVIVCGVIWLMAKLMLWRERDLEALERAFGELERRNQELDEFAGRVAHDLRSPLTTAMLYVGMLPAAQPAGGAQAEVEDGLRDSLEDMSQLIGELLETARKPLSNGGCDVERMLEAVVRSMEADIAATGTRITHDPLPRVAASEAHVRLVLQNLIQNSIKYRGPRTPAIHIRATQSEGFWRFDVQDNGVGIRPEEAGRIFDRLSRGEASTGTQGVGLGLSACKSAVEQYGGRIWVGSSGREGALVCFTLPTMGERAGATQAPAATPRGEPDIEVKVSGHQPRLPVQGIARG